MHAYAARIAIFSLILGAIVSPAPARAQATGPVKVTVTVAGKTETLRGTGRCGHEPRAWLNGAAAALWLAEYEGASAQHVSLSYWRPAAAGADEQFSLSVQSGRGAHRINTIKNGKPEGSGRTTFRPTALGGRFEITGKDQDGTTFRATIECARFGGIYAEGG